MHVFITGAGGQLGRALSDAFLGGHAVTAYPHAALDVTDRRAVRAAVRAAKPDAAVHCAAWTDVDGCERDPRRARLVNAEGARHVAEALPRSAALVYVSTDFVFSGRKKTPYVEDDKPAPPNVYGKTKRQGERYALRHPRAYVVRTSWLYGLHGRHFVGAVLAKAEAGEALRVVRDQVGAPTFAFDLAQQIKILLERETPPGVYHVTNGGACSRREFAKAILGEYNSMKNVRVAGIRSAQMPRPAKRPLNSCLSNEKLRRTGVPLLRHWRAALRHYCRLTAWR